MTAPNGMDNNDESVVDDEPLLQIALPQANTSPAHSDMGSDTASGHVRFQLAEPLSRRRIIARWQVAYTLIRNPLLMHTRRRGPLEDDVHVAVEERLPQAPAPASSRYSEYEDSEEVTSLLHVN